MLYGINFASVPDIDKPPDGGTAAPSPLPYIRPWLVSLELWLCLAVFAEAVAPCCRNDAVEEESLAVRGW